MYLSIRYQSQIKKNTLSRSMHYTLEILIFLISFFVTLEIRIEIFLYNHIRWKGIWNLNLYKNKKKDLYIKKHKNKNVSIFFCFLKSIDLTQYFGWLNYWNSHDLKLIHFVLNIEIKKKHWMIPKILIIIEAIGSYQFKISYQKIKRLFNFFLIKMCYKKMLLPFFPT